MNKYQKYLKIFCCQDMILENYYNSQKKLFKKYYIYPCSRVEMRYSFLQILKLLLFHIQKPCFVAGWGALSSGGISPDALHSVYIEMYSDEYCEAESAYGDRFGY